ncbi:CYTH domain-containing protein [Fictibacillus phosphorivorans]|uniref:CYTH domain-containing protein n=1 Tax=Fictibacillus phosphorivorans TaxID=1221500 RepID=UPI0012CB42D2|nr:CYTH domain-containing protein [Fictibacillus phosphorivorans]MQR96740.1 CYTH domain-containing protein [Fictibacillus phosphorivorans]
MSQEIEIEFKNLLTQLEFLRLIDEFDVKQETFYKQTNYYFDTQQFDLKHHRSALRVRTKNNGNTLTLKQKLDKHILETHQTVSEEIFEGLLNGDPLPSGEVSDQIKKMNIDVKGITYLGELTTFRAEFPYKDGLLVLDENYYLGKIDYEIEYESADYISGLNNFNELLTIKQIPVRDTESKIARFFNESSKN